MTRTFSLLALLTDAEEEDGDGEDEGVDTASMSSRGLQGLFREEDDDEILFRRVPRLKVIVIDILVHC